jgi:hypothetical protein
MKTTQRRHDLVQSLWLDNITRGLLTERPAWKAVVEHYQNVRHVHLRSLFADDPGASG